MSISKRCERNLKLASVLNTVAPGIPCTLRSPLSLRVDGHPQTVPSAGDSIQRRCERLQEDGMPLAIRLSCFSAVSPVVVGAHGISTREDPDAVGPPLVTIGPAGDDLPDVADRARRGLESNLR